MTTPTVSVAMIAYNHHDYIIEAIQSIVQQECNFDVELIIVNDNSSDNTHQKIEQFIANYNGKIRIRYYNNTINKGINHNFYYSLSLCTGNYIAICEGDDYWCDNKKLQKQFDIINKNESISIVVHKTQMLAPYKKIRGKRWEFCPHYPIASEYSNLATIMHPIQRYPFHTSSFFINRRLLNLEEYFNLIADINICDIQLIAYMATKGSIYYIDEIMSKYRIHEGGTTTLYWNLQDYIKLKLNFIKHLEHFKSITNDENYAIIRKFIRSEYYFLAELYFKEKQAKACRQNLLKSIPSIVLTDKDYIKTTLVMAFYSIFPKFYNKFLRDNK